MSDASTNTGTPAAPSLGFGQELGGEGEGRGDLSTWSAPAKPKRPRIDAESQAMDAINAAAGYTTTAPVAARTTAKRKRKPAAKPALPRIGPDPLNWVEDIKTRGTLSVPGPDSVFEDFKALREEYGQSGWVVLNMLLKHFRHNPPQS